MLRYNQIELKKLPRNSYDYLLGVIHGFIYGFIPLSIYFIFKNKNNP